MAPSTRSAIRQIILIYFLTFAVRGLFLPFANLYLKDSGFSGTQIGVVTGITALLQLTLPPLLNTWADRAGQHRRLLSVLLLTNITALSGLVTFTGKVWLGAALLVRNSSDRLVDPLMSQLTITWLDRHKRDIYGRLRGWGSFGWGIVALFSGRIFALGGYTLLFLLSALFHLLTLRFTGVLPPRTTETEQLRQGTRSREPGLYLVLVSLFLYFTAMTASYTFMYIYFQDTLGASKEMIGILASVAALSEIPSMMFIDAWLRRVNILVTLIAGIAGMSVIWVAYALLASPTLLIPLMIIRGTFYTFQIVSIVLLVSRISHPANAATNQSLAMVTIPGLSTLLTGPVSGWIFDHLGGRMLFVSASASGALAILVLFIARRYLVIRPGSGGARSSPG